MRRWPLLLCFLTACASQAGGPEHPLTRVTSVDASLAGSDGLPIHYRLVGGGEPTVVLLHGWSLDLGIWTATIDHLAPQHQVLALDLAGHGQSGHERSEWTVEQLGADVVAVLRALDLQHVVLVGHSMGSEVALEASRHLGSRVVGVIAVDDLQQVGHPMPEAARDELLQGFDKNFPEAARTFADRLLGSAASPDVRAEIETAYAAAPPAIALPLLRAAFGYDTAGAVGELRAPLRIIASTSKPDPVALRRLHADSEIVDLTGKGLGHFPMLEGPEIFAPALETALHGFAAPQAERPR
jgi:pimeloyl-ACP methyl ester carboxylesterase